MTTKLDLKDKKLLYELDINARQTYSQLAKKTGMSKQLVKYRVERLEKIGVINRYITLIDIYKLGYTLFRVYIKFRNIDLEAKKEMADYLIKQKATFMVGEFSGKWDFGFFFNVKNIFDFYKYWDVVLEKYLEYINEYTIAIYSPVYHYSKAYLIEENDTSPVRVMGGTIKEQIDPLDSHILHHLAENARISLVKLSSILKKSPEIISYRIKQLEKRKIIIGYRALLNNSLLNITFYKVDIRLKTLKNLKSILSYCHQEPNIFQVNRTIGGETLEVEFQVKSLDELHEHIEKMEKQFPDTFEKYDYYVIYKELKVKYIPEE